MAAFALGSVVGTALEFVCDTYKVTFAEMVGANFRQFAPDGNRDKPCQPRSAGHVLDKIRLYCKIDSGDGGTVRGFLDFHRLGYTVSKFNDLHGEFSFVN